MLSKIKALLPKSDNTPKQPDSQYLVALDIGTENVKALICRVKDDGAEIVGVGRAHQGLSDMQAGAISDIAGVVANCEKALTEAEKMAKVSAKSAVIGIAGELVKGATTTIALRRRDPNTTITMDELNRVIKAIQVRAQEKAKKQLMADLGGKEVDIKLVNSALVSIDIDGYAVTNPVGFQGKLITVELYSAFAPLVHIGAIERTAEQLSLELLNIAAEPFAVARSVVGNDPNTNMSAVLIDIGGGTTDIAVLNDGGVEGTNMFGIGGRAFTRSIERELNTDYETAEHFKLSVDTAHEAPKRAEKVRYALNQTLDVWQSGIELALAEFRKLDHLPNKVLLCGGGAGLKMLIDRLEEGDWYKDLPFTKKPSIQLIEPSEVVGIIDKTGKIIDHTSITAMGLARVGLDSIGQFSQSEKMGIKERLNKLLSI